MTEGTKETMWYPVFNLKENPFAELDDMTKFHRLVENEAWGQVTSALETQENVVVVGGMGTGKTNMARNILQNEETRKTLLRRMGISGCCGSIGKSNIQDVEGDLIETGLIDPMSEKGAKEFYEFLESHIWLFCKQCEETCLRQSLREEGLQELLESFKWWTSRKQNYNGWMNCRLVENFVLLSSFMEGLLVVDCPNVVEPRLIRDLDGLVKRWLSSSNRRILLFCTPEQHRKLTKVSDLFRPEKIRMVELEKPEPQFFHKLVEARIREGERKQDPKPEIPFKREAITTIAEASDYNPRQFLRLCSTILTKAKQKGQAEPIDEGFLKESGMPIGESFIRRIEEAYKAYEDTTGNLKLLMEHLLGLGDWISIADHMSELCKLISCKPETIYKYVRNLEQLNLIEAKMVGKPPKKFVRALHPRKL